MSNLRGVDHTGWEWTEGVWENDSYSRRELFDLGKDAGIAEERAQVVAWLKQTANYSPELKRRYHSDDYALAVERGEHRPTDVERRQLFRFGAMKGDKK